jgi:pyruvyl transferase EpsI
MNLKKIINFRIKYRVLLFLQSFKALDVFNANQIDSKKNQAYIFLAADYGNLGDVAITYAQTSFIENYTDYETFEIPISKSLEGLHFVRRHIKPGDIITTVGGGNMGELYDQIEFIRQLTIKFFPNNRIISFPQTFDFTDTPAGKKALTLAIKTYNKHPDLTIVARETHSFELMQKHFTNATILLTPDIVLSLDETKPPSERKGAVCCLRSDKEQKLTGTQKEFILKKVGERFTEVQDYDTHIGRNNLSVKERIIELNKIWYAFRSAELVITDRLHGMIFCHITNTPCLVFLNNNHKVKGTYKWIKNNKNITLMESFSEQEIALFLSRNNFIENGYTSLIKEYNPLIDVLK